MTTTKTIRRLWFIGVLLGIVFCFVSPVKAQQKGDFAAGLAEFVAVRNRALTDPTVSRASFDALIRDYAARFPPEKRTSDERARATFEGMYDLSPAQEEALQSLAVDAQSSTGEGVSAAAARLRLSPSAETLRALLDHPYLPEAMASPRSAAVIESLLWTNSALLKPMAAAVAQAIARLDAATYPAAALAAPALTLILAQALPDATDFYPAERRLLDFGKNALASDNLTDLQKRELRVTLSNLTTILEPFTPDAKDFPPSTRELITRWRVQLEARSLLSVRGGGRTAILFSRQVVHGEPPIFLPSPNRLHATTTTVRDAMSAPGAATTWRGFGGVALSDPTYRFDADDMGIDSVSQRGFARNPALNVFPYFVKADAVAIAPERGGISGFAAGAALFGWPFFEIRGQNIGADETQRVTLKNTSLRALGIRLLTIRSLSGKFTLPAVLPEDEESPPPPPTAPRGSSPTRDWLKMPSFGIEEGKIVIGYNNAIKFAGRFTGVARLYSFGLSSAGYRAGLNYNLFKVHNGADKIIETIDLQQNLLDSRYFNITRDDFSAENKRLYDNNLFIGAVTAKNEPYQRPDGTRGIADTDYSVALDGVRTVGQYLFVRGQAARQKISEAELGGDTRWAFTGILGTRQIPVARGVTVSGRVEGIERRGGSGTYGWIRGYAGVSLKFLEGLRLSVAGVQSAEKGTPRFPSDRVAADRDIALRADFLIGSLRFGYLNQYSLDKRTWLRTQGIIGVPVGGFEPYISYDQRFHRISFGINVRLDEFVDRFRFRRATAIGIR